LANKKHGTWAALFKGLRIILAASAPSPVSAMVGSAAPNAGGAAVTRKSVKILALPAAPSQNPSYALAHIGRIDIDRRTGAR